jgi:hypothetical protein
VLRRVVVAVLIGVAGQQLPFVASPRPDLAPLPLQLEIPQGYRGNIVL